MDGADFANLHFDASFFREFPAGSVADVLSPFDVAAGDAPFADVAAGRPATHQDAAVVIKQDYRDADGGVSEMDEAARCAGWSRETAPYCRGQRLGAARAETVVGGEGLGHWVGVTD